jgi:endogenous inhibitor of DNA gyrase (YacG/DUF329 family)
MEKEKACPKCQTAMETGPYKMVLPAATNTRLAPAKPISENAGVELSLYHCPACGFVELYYLSSFRPV